MLLDGGLATVEDQDEVWCVCVCVCRRCDMSKTEVAEHVTPSWSTEGAPILFSEIDRFLFACAAR